MGDDKKVRAAIDSFILHGDRIPGSPGVAGASFEFHGVSVRYDGCTRRQVWDDASDGWVSRWAPCYTVIPLAAPAEAVATRPSPAPTTTVPGVRYAIVVLSSTFAVAGQSGRAAATSAWHKATTWATPEQAQAQIVHFAEIDPFDFKPANEPRVVAIGKRGPIR